MAKVKWTEDYGVYKKGDEFDIESAETLQYYLDSGKVEVVKHKAETKTEVSEAPAPKASAPAKKTHKK